MINSGHLIWWLRKQMDEDVAVARAFQNDLGEVRPWRADEIGGTVREIGPLPFGLPDVISESDTHLTAAHIARHDPASVLADVAAKKAIVDRCEAALSAPPLPVEGHLALGVLLDLATGYSGRDGYGGWET